MRMTRKMRRTMKRREMLNQVTKIAMKAAMTVASTVMLLGGAVANAMPTGGQVTAGQAAIAQAGSQMTISQATASAAINWQSFSIGAQEQVRFIQPSASSVILNRIVGTDASAIYGQMSANGRLFMVNPNGILFAPGSRVDVGGLVASTLNISNEDFLSGRYAFNGKSGVVINQGTLTAADQGYVALLGAQARNEGLIVAKLGTAAIGAGEQVNLDFGGDGKVSLNVNKGVVGAVAANSGLIEADGGRVIMTTRAGDDLASAVVNQSGIIRARSLGSQTGSVVLASSGDIQLKGQVDVSGRKAGESGGTASIVAAGNLEFPSGSVVDASGSVKGGAVETSGKTVQIAGDVKAGEWLIDPIDITIIDTSTGTGTISPATSTISADVIVSALNTANVTIDTGTTSANGSQNGNITVSADIAAANSSDRTLKLTAANNIIVDSGKAISTTGSGRLNVTLEASSEGANGGRISVAGATILTNGGTLTLSGKDGSGGNRALSVDATQPGVNLTGATINTSRTGVTGGDIVVRAQVNATTGQARGIDTSNAVLTTGGGAVTLDGIINPGSSDANAAGVYLGDTTSINTVGTTARGAISITGQNSSGNGIRLGGSITGGDLSLTADRIGFGGTMTGSVSNTATITTKTSGRTVSIGDDGGASTLNVSGFTSFAGFGKHVVKSTGAVTIKNAALSQDTDIQATGGISVTGPLDGNSHSLRLAAGGASDGAGTITDVDGLRLEGGTAVSWNFTSTANDINTLSADVQSVNFQDVNDLTLGQVSVGSTAYDKVTVYGGSTAISAGGNVTLAQNLVKASGSTTNVTIQAADDIAFTNSARITAAGQALNLNLYADTDGNGGRVVGQFAQTYITTLNGSLTIAGGNPTGTGYAKGTAAGAGVDLSNATIDVGSGTLAIRGEAYSNTTTGIKLTNAKITRMGIATIEGKQPSAGSGPAVDLSGVTISSGPGLLTLTGDTMTFSGGSIAGSGGLRIQPLSPGGNINLGSASTAGQLNIGSTVFAGTDAASIVKNGFSSIIIGRDDGTGTITESGTFTFRDNLTLQAPLTGGAINIQGTITDGTGLNEPSTLTLKAPTVNLNSGTQLITHATGAGITGITVDSTTTNLADSITLNANGGDISITADTLGNQDKNFSLISSGGILSIRQKTGGRGLELGGTDSGTGLFIDNLASDNITGFSHVKLGRTDGGAAAIDGYTAPSIKTTVLSGAGGTMTGTVTAANGLILATGGLNQTGGTLTASELGLIGPGSYSFAQTGNQITKVATDSGSKAVSSLALTNSTALTVGTVTVPSAVSNDNPLTGITATGAVSLTVTNGAQLTIANPLNAGSAAVTLKADEMAVNANVRTTGILTLGPNTGSTAINIGSGATGLDFAAALFSPPNGYLGGNYSKIIIGSTTQQSGAISVSGTTFSTEVEIDTNKTPGANVNLTGIINVGAATAPFKNFTIRANQLTTDATVNVKDLLLDLNQFSGISGTVNGGGNLTITGPSGQDILLEGSETAAGYSNVYVIPYTTVNSVFLGFSNFAITATGTSADSTAADVILQTGTLNRSLSLTSNDKVIIDGTVTLGAGASQVTINAPVFQLNGGAANKGTIDAGKTSFTIITDKIDDRQGSANNITSDGTGTLTLKPKTKNLVILGMGVTGDEGTELLISAEQINGGLFKQGAFKNLILGDNQGNLDTEIRTGSDSTMVLDNNLTIAAGSGNVVKITGSKGLQVGSGGTPRSVTLQGGTVTTNNNLLDAQNGTLTIAANTLNLGTTANMIKGSGTLGITTFDGNRAIYVGTDGPGSVLNLNQTIFNTGGPIDWSNFTHVRIGSATQGGAISVNGLTTPGHLTGVTFQTSASGSVIFAGNLTASGDVVTVDTGTSSQTGGIITASAINLQTGDHVLNRDNAVDTLAANAKSISFTSVNPLTVGTVALSDSGSTSGVTASGTDANTINLTGKNTTEETGGLQITQPILATSSGGITLTGDELKFTGTGSVKSSGGALILQPWTQTRTITMGGTDTTGLDLPVSYFNGSVIKDGFSTVTIGTTATSGNSGTINIEGTAPLVFVDNTVIQSALTNGTVNLASGVNIQHGANSLEFRTATLNANAGGTEATITGTGAQIFTVNRLDVNNGNFASTGSLTIRGLDAARGITIGATDTDANQLFLNQDWFKSTDSSMRTFTNGYNQITIGNGTSGTGKITVKDDVAFTDNTTLSSLGSTGSIDIGLSGTPNIPAKLTMTNGDDLTLEASTITTYGVSTIQSYAGTTILTADTMAYDSTSHITGTGQLYVQPYTKGRSISLGANIGSTLNLSSSTINSVFTTGHSLITIGHAQSSGAFTLNGVTFHDNVAFRNPSGSISIIGAVDMTSHPLTFNVPAGSVSGAGTLSNVSKLSGSAKSIDLYSTMNTITRIENLTTVQDMKVTNTGNLSLDGMVRSTGGDVTIRTMGNLTLEATGTVSAPTVGSVNRGRVFLAADNASGFYTNNFINKSGSDGITAGKQFLIFSGRRENTTRDGLGETVLRFGSKDFDKPGAGQAIPDSQSGFLYAYQPIVRLSATKVYGNVATDFGYTEVGTTLADNGFTLKTAGLDQLSSYSFTGVNIDGVENKSANPGDTRADVNASGYMGEFTGTGINNPYGFLVQGPTTLKIPFYVTPRDLIIQMANATRAYGDPNSAATFDGTTSITTVASYSGLVNDDKVTVVSQSFDGITQGTDAGTYNGTVLGDKDHVVFAKTSDFQNYTIKVNPGNTIITKRNVTVQSPNVSRYYGDVNPDMGNGFSIVSGSLYGSDSITLTNTLVSPVGQFDPVNASASAITPSNLQYSGETAKASNYNITLQDGVFSITPRPITIQMADIRYIYGDTPTEANLIGGVWTGNGSAPNGRVKSITGVLVNGDTISNIDLNLVGISSTTAAGSSGAPYLGAVQSNATDNSANVTFSHGLRSNYTVTVVRGNATVVPRPLVIEAASYAKIYGNANSTAVQTAAYSVKADGISGSRGLVNSDRIDSVTNTINAGLVSETTNVGTVTNAVDASSPVFGAGSASNYQITYLKGDVAVTQRDVQVASPGLSRYYGYDNPIIGGSSFSFVSPAGTALNGVGLVNGDTIASVTHTYASSATVTANAGTTHAITPSAPVFSSGSGSNYRFIAVDGTLTITKAPLTVTADDKYRTYGDANPAFTRTITGFRNSDNESVIAGLAGLSTAATTASDVGNYVISTDVSGLSSTNYTFTPVNGTLTINPRALTIAMNDASFVYGNSPGLSDLTAASGTWSGNAGLTPNAKVKSVNGLVNGDRVADVALQFVGVDSTSNAGTYAGSVRTNAATVSFETASDRNNYTVTIVNGNTVVTPRPITVTAGSASRMYGDLNPVITAFTVSPGSLVNGDTISSVTNTIASTATATANAGTSHAVTPSAPVFSSGLASNYQFIAADGTLSITKAPLTVTADDKYRTYGDGNPVFTRTITGFRNSDNESVIAGLVGLSTAATTASDVGSYAIATDVSGLSATNYTFTPVNGTLTVNPRALTITMNDASFVYGNNPGLSDLTAASGTWSGNGGLTPNTKVKAVNGLVNGDRIADIALQIVGVDSTSNAGTYTGSVRPDAPGNAATVSFETASDRNNYTISIVNGNTVVSPRPITVTAGSGSRIYGDANPVITAFTISVGSLVNGDTLNSVTNTIAPTATATANAGTSHAVTASSPIFAEPSDSNNYSITYLPGTLSITQRPLIIQAPSGIRRQGEDNGSTQFTPAAFDPSVQVLADGQSRTISGTTVTSRGLVNGDTVTATGTPVVDATLTRTTGTGTYEDKVGVDNAVFGTGQISNYAITYAPNAITINASPVASPDAEAAKTYSKEQGTTEPPNNPPPGSGNTGSLNINSGSGNVRATVQITGGGIEFTLGGNTGERPAFRDGGRRDNAGIPVLYTTSAGENVRFDGVYKVNYDQNKLAILPSTLDVPVPSTKEITRGSFVEFSMIQSAGQAGLFEVNIGNGIITIKPIDEVARATLTRQNDKDTTKTIMGAGILSAVQDLGVMPDQVRAIYIYTE